MKRKLISKDKYVEFFPTVIGRMLFVGLSVLQRCVATVQVRRCVLSRQDESANTPVLESIEEDIVPGGSHSDLYRGA